MTQNERWLSMFDTYMDFIRTNKRCPSKYKPEDRNLVNWAKYNRKMRNKGLLSDDRLRKMAELADLSAEYRRVNQHAYLNDDKNTADE